MKKPIAFLLAFTLVLSLTACSQASANDLMTDVPARAVDVLPDMDAGSAAAADFGVKLFQTSLDEGKNTLISPLSVLYALAMTANGADGETLAQMEQVLGMDCDSLNSYMLAYLDLLPESKAYKMRLANSIWFNDDPNFVVEQSFLQTNADYYGAGAYKAAFDEATRDDINNWVKEHTDGMIPEIIDKIPDEAIMYLVNALAFDAQWDEIYMETQVRSGFFTKEDGTQQDVQMMHSDEHRYLEDELATGFIKYYEGRKYAFAAMLPNEGVTVQQYVDSLTGSHLREILSNPEDILVYTSIPKFETEYDIEMSEILQEMGMTDAFDGTTADFSRLGSYNVDGMNVCIGRVLHKTFISVAEQGTKAGAATAVEMVPEAAAEIPDYKIVCLDRPFVYMLIDCETNLPFFIGTMMDVKDDHKHTLAEAPQIVDDPVTGYCGNTMTTIAIDGQEYTFMGSDSVNLTDILINLKYDPMRVCRCAPEFTVKTEFGEPYGVDLTNGYARCKDGQADLTVDQIDLIQKILDNQT